MPRSSSAHTAVSKNHRAAQQRYGKEADAGSDLDELVVGLTREQRSYLSDGTYQNRKANNYDSDEGEDNINPYSQHGRGKAKKERDELAKDL